MPSPGAQIPRDVRSKPATKPPVLVRLRTSMSTRLLRPPPFEQQTMLVLPVALRRSLGLLLKEQEDTEAALAHAEALGF